MKNFAIGFMLGACIALIGAGLYVNVKIGSLREQAQRVNGAIDQTTKNLEGLKRFNEGINERINERR